MQLPEAPVVYPLGVRGDGLERVNARWRTEWACRGELRRKVPDAVLLSVGLNDTARVGSRDGRQQLTPEAFVFGLSQLLDEIRQSASVMVMGMTAVDEHVMPYAECLWYSNNDIEAMEAATAEACRDIDVPFLSLHGDMLAEPDWLTWMEPDGIHLNSDGHGWIERKISAWPALMAWAGLEPTLTSVPIRM
jgi:lysophospholipase L1-like esterase